jgi:hypothetical protein
MVSSGFPAKPSLCLSPSPKMSMSRHLIPFLISNTDHEAATFAAFPATLLSRLSQINDNKKDTKKRRNNLVKIKINPINQILYDV